MKKILLWGSSIVLSFFIGHICHAAIATDICLDNIPITDPCAPIEVDMYFFSTPQERSSFFQCEFDHYNVRLCGDAYYKLNFVITHGPAQLVSGVVFDQNPDKPIIISGLQLMRSSGTFDLLTINSNQPVSLIDSDIGPNSSGACLVLRGADHDVKSSNIHNCADGVRIEGNNNFLQGIDVHDSGVGIKLIGDSSRIVGSNIYNNATEGIRIEGNNNFLGALNDSKFQTESNSIYGNKIGINWVSGSGNRFAYNKIYQNQVGQTNTSNDAIFIDPALGIPRLQIELINQDTETALHCEDSNDDGIIDSRWIVVHQVNAGEEVVIYKTDAISPYQAVDYLTKCVVGQDGKCPFVFPASISVPNTQCGVDLKTMALVNALAYTSMLNDDPYRFKLDGVVAIGTAAPIDIISSNPGSEMGGGDGGGAEGGGGGGEIVSSAPVDNILGGGDSSGPGAGGSCGASIIPNDAHNTFGSGLFMWWIIFAAPVATLCAIRIRKRR